jgi:hypothetical protein
VLELVEVVGFDPELAGVVAFVAGAEAVVVVVAGVVDGAVPLYPNED